ncbi:uncharacterized protein LOC125648134 isoform X2 [Ostrea edulis]|uniref:uncharacterized protein LOC125648134 isoform X2 n=1 Tax=Ostrea edulis TaxID=37623 RepID=UPI0024AFD559|nr:uncharacterized protein LOC125648134 isoform X2 [Ostrea edulis]
MSYKGSDFETLLKRMIGVLVSLLVLSTSAFLPGRCHILRDMQESTQFWTNSKQEGFRDTGCNISAGWNLTGREWGCCGNYEGCCKMATKFCYLHDSICQCCQLGWFICGPECKPDVECLSTKEEADSEDEFSNTMASPSSQLSVTSSINENKTLQDQNSTNTNNKVNKNSAVKNGGYKMSDSALLHSIAKQAQSVDRQVPSLVENSQEQVRRDRDMKFTTTKSVQTKDDTQYTDTKMGIVKDELEFPELNTNTHHSNIIEGSGEVD